MKCSMSLVSSDEVLFFVQVTIGKHTFNRALHNAVYFLSVLAVYPFMVKASSSGPDFFPINPMID